jgi:hypothetical protein
MTNIDSNKNYYAFKWAVSKKRRPYADTMILTLDDHFNKFNKVINRNWKKWSETKKQINRRVNFLKYHYRDPHESDDFVRFELFYMYLNGGYDKKYDPTRSNLMTYVIGFIDSHLDPLLEQRQKRKLWDNGEREININGYKKKIRYKSCDIYDKCHRQSFGDSDHYRTPSECDTSESRLLNKERLELFYEYAKSKGRTDEAKIIIGLEDYDSISRRTSLSVDTIRKRVHRLIESFNRYYDDLI